MKTINKIFLVIAAVILTPTVMLVAFILIADATDMDLNSVVWGTEAETSTDEELLAEGELAGTPPATEVQTEAEIPPEGEGMEEVQGDQQESSGTHLAANPPANWTPTPNNGAIQQQLNMDAWNASPSSSPSASGSNTATGNNAQTQTDSLPDPAQYLKAILDVVYKNDSNTYINLKIGTAEEAAELYEETLDEDTINDLLDNLGFAEVQADERMGLIKQILASVRYNVGEAKKQNDGSYVVTVAYEKMNIYMPTVDAYIKKAESMIAGWNRAGSAGGEVPSYESMNEQLIETYTQCLRETFGNVTYEKSQNATIRMKVVNKVYEINDEDITKLGTLLTDSDAAMEKLNKAMDKWEF